MNNKQIRKCPRCDIIKDINEYSQTNSYCKQCHRDYAKDKRKNYLVCPECFQFYTYGNKYRHTITFEHKRLEERYNKLNPKHKEIIYDIAKEFYEK